MSLRWTDVHAIGEALYDRDPEMDPMAVRFTDLMKWVMALPDFSDTTERCGEKVLEGIQMAWLEEWQADQT